MHVKQQTPTHPLVEGTSSPPTPSAASGPVRARVGTVWVRRGSTGPLTCVEVPEGTSALHAGMDHLQQPPGLDAVDEWFVIEQ